MGLHRPSPFLLVYRTWSASRQEYGGPLCRTAISLRVRSPVAGCPNFLEAKVLRHCSAVSEPGQTQQTFSVPPDCEQQPKPVGCLESVIGGLRNAPVGGGTVQKAKATKEHP